MRISTWLNGGDFLHPTHLRVDALMFGVFFSYLYCFRGEALDCFFAKYGWIVFLLSLAALSQLVLADLDNAYMATVGFTVNSLASGGILLFCFYKELWFAERRIFRWLAVIGANCYSIYLWHMFAKRSVSFVRKTFIDIPYLIEWLLFVALAVSIGMIAARFVEQPVLRLRDRLFPSNSGSLPPTNPDLKPGLQGTRSLTCLKTQESDSK